MEYSGAMIARAAPEVCFILRAAETKVTRWRVTSAGRIASISSRLKPIEFRQIPVLELDLKLVQSRY